MLTKEKKMIIRRETVTDNSVAFGEIPASIAFDWNGMLCILIDKANKLDNVKGLEDGTTFCLSKEVRVIPRPNAEIHIDPHPAEAKLKRMVAGLRGLMECAGLVETFQEGIKLLLESDDEQD